MQKISQRISKHMVQKANRKGNRLAEMEDSCGFISTHKVHKTQKDYSRKDKSWKQNY
jgi:hypothetical protein